MKLTALVPLLLLCLISTVRHRHPTPAAPALLLFQIGSEKPQETVPKKQQSY